MKNGMMKIGWTGLAVMGAMACLAAEPAVRVHTEVPLKVNADGSATLSMQPRSFALIEF